MEVPAVEIRQLAVCLSGRPVLQLAELAFPAGRWTAVVGPNGAGKSTLLRALAGLSRGADPKGARGDIRLLGRPLAQWHPRQRAQTLAWLGQQEAGSEDLSALDVALLGRMPHQHWSAGASDADRQIARSALGDMGAADLAERRLGELSGGERQRVLLARALAVQARVMLMDEPLAHLDPPHQADWLRWVQTACRNGSTVVSVLHELNVALMADVLVVLKNGALVHAGPPHDPVTRAALQTAFDGRLALREVDSRWVAWPV